MNYDLTSMKPLTSHTAPKGKNLSLFHVSGDLQFITVGIRSVKVKTYYIIFGVFLAVFVGKINFYFSGKLFNYILIVIYYILFFYTNQS